MSIAPDDAWPEDREPSETYLADRIFLQPHDVHISKSAFWCASNGREQRERLDPSGLTTASEDTDHADLKGHQVLFTPSQTPSADTDAGRRKNRLALRDHAPREFGDFCLKAGIGRIQLLLTRGPKPAETVLRLTMTISVHDG